MTEPIAFISDIHGNYPALDAVLKDIHQRGIQQVYCLGDLIGFNSMVNEVVDRLREEQIPCIMGNHDYALIHNEGRIDRSKTATRILQRQQKELSSENISFLAEMPESRTISRNNRKLMMVHGGMQDPIDEYLLNFDQEYADNYLEDTHILATGHTHQFFCKQVESGQMHLNPASIGQPRDGDPRASYGILEEDNSFVQVRVEYPVDVIVEDMKRKGYEEYIFQVLYRGVRIGQ
ncbi:metallophosphoesterase family protein [bacterium SCSIO 12741]|nr:metallophosphoesterase family protein [bacterium SCSIO 12741]